MRGVNNVAACIFSQAYFFTAGDSVHSYITLVLYLCTAIKANIRGERAQRPSSTEFQKEKNPLRVFS